MNRSWSRWNMKWPHLVSTFMGFWMANHFTSHYYMGKLRASDQCFTHHRLFEKMKLNEALLQTGTWPTFIELLDNYNPVTGVPELKSKQEILEEDQFINAILRTEVMEELWKTLKNASKCDMNFMDFITIMIQLSHISSWFLWEMYCNVSTCLGHILWKEVKILANSTINKCDVIAYFIHLYSRMCPKLTDADMLVF